VGHVRPIAVHVYTIDRPPADRGLQKVSAQRLREIGDLLHQRTRIPTEVF